MSKLWVIVRTQVAGAMLMSSAALAQDPGSRQTREFVQAAIESDGLEIMEAHAALAQSTDPQVISFAQMMIRDHGETSRAMQDAATRAGLKPPVVALGAGQAPFLAALQSQHGVSFDRIYWMQQALAHRSALVVDERYATGGDNGAVRQAAAAAIPVIRSHLEIAERMTAAIPAP